MARLPKGIQSAGDYSKVVIPSVDEMADKICMTLDGEQYYEGKPCEACIMTAEVVNEMLMERTI